MSAAWKWTAMRFL
uniref:Uncharacterized protein n=1 Tax=Arundo donax TaxID=35708 RepID=A0A0A9CHT4_ARUDO